jgi:hypothetical protein
MVGFTSILLATGLPGQTNVGVGHMIPFLEPDSQNNIIIKVNGLLAPRPCPPEYTNLVSNTNLFSVSERKLLEELPARYKNVTTNCGPPGTVLVGLSNSSIGLLAHFQYTNSNASEEVTFSALTSVKFRNGSGDGYDVELYNPDAYRVPGLGFTQIKHGVMEGLTANFYGDHCTWWMHFREGKAVGKWFAWDRRGNLLLEAEFKEPYDYLKYRIPWRPRTLNTTSEGKSP